MSHMAFSLGCTAQQGHMGDRVKPYSMKNRGERNTSGKEKTKKAYEIKSKETIWS